MKIAHAFSPPIRPKPPKVKRDTNQERSEKAYVRARDNGCVAARAYRSNDPSSEIPIYCAGPLDVDHVRASGGLGMKSPTHRTNLVVLCRHHHDAKTQYGKTWRPLLLAYLERVEGRS